MYYQKAKVAKVLPDISKNEQSAIIKTGVFRPSNCLIEILVCIRNGRI